MNCAEKLFEPPKSKMYTINPGYKYESGRDSDCHFYM